MPDLGACYKKSGQCLFTVWAPFLKALSLHLTGKNDIFLPMAMDAKGFWSIDVLQAPPGTRYTFRFEDGKDRPDPASFDQPEDIFGASCVVDHSAFWWQDDDWKSPQLEEMVFYELHVGAFTPLGTFEAIIERLDDLKDLGVNALELMPVAQFPGKRGWGYDGVFPYAVQHSYGGPAGLKALVNACHLKGMAVVLDVVYNHFGPEGNILAEFMPCFNEKYQTPWGMAINFDGPDSWGVRNFLIQNALYWFRHYHVDALRLDAVHGMHDMSAKHFLKELCEEISLFPRKVYLIAESDLNDVRAIGPFDKGGWGLDAQWNDDFHHALHALLTNERQGYYGDFGKVAHLAKAQKEGFVYSWDYSSFRRRFHGSSSSEVSAKHFIVYSQNHDQIGNRLKGERLSGLISFEGLKLAAAAVLLSPYIPLIFMGEEYAEDSPFLYFMDFKSQELLQAVREGRKKEFSRFQWKEEPVDPHEETAFLRSRIDWGRRIEEKGAVMLSFYQKLIRLRKSVDALAHPDKERLKVRTDEALRVLTVIRWFKESLVCVVMNFNSAEIQLTSGALLPGDWNKILDSSDTQWLGPGNINPGVITTPVKNLVFKPQSCVVFEKISGGARNSLQTR
ncbi:MAG: malto-oligosyltrehalose trehalohydrolase [Candidatus Omnitrophota bacterium]